MINTNTGFVEKEKYNLTNFIINPKPLGLIEELEVVLESKKRRLYWSKENSEKTFDAIIKDLLMQRDFKTLKALSLDMGLYGTCYAEHNSMTNKYKRVAPWEEESHTKVDLVHKKVSPYRGFSQNTIESFQTLQPLLKQFYETCRKVTDK